MVHTRQTRYTTARRPRVGSCPEQAETEEIVNNGGLYKETEKQLKDYNKSMKNIHLEQKIDYNSSKYVECAVCETKIHHECIDHIDNKRYDLSGHDDLNKKPVCDE